MRVLQQTVNVEGTGNGRMEHCVAPEGQGKAACTRILASYVVLVVNMPTRLPKVVLAHH